MKTGNGVVGTGQAVVGEKGNALASRCAHQGIIVGDIHAGIGRCQGLVSTGTGALPWVAATRRKGTGGMGSENAALLPTARCSQGACSGPGRHIP